MFILYAIPLGILIGLLVGGRVGGIASIRVQGWAVIVAAFAVQTVLFGSGLGHQLGLAGAVLYVGSTAAVLVALLADIRTPGLGIVAAGAASNLVAIVANGGIMPADAAAYAAQGATIGDRYTNVRFVADPVLPFLTDIIALPAWLPFSNVISIGDLLIAAGIVAAIATAMHRERVGFGGPAAR